MKLQDETTSPRRGRPPKHHKTDVDTRMLLIRSGVEVLTESSFASAGIDGILKKVGVPKGSFYYYFKNKEAFGLAVIDEYARYFDEKLQSHLLSQDLPPLKRLESFVHSADAGMKKYHYKRGCLVGNLGQEIGLLPDSFRQELQDIFSQWQQRVADCLIEAQQAGDLLPTTDCQQLAEYFWLGWEGAVMRAKLIENGEPLRLYFQGFMAGLPISELHISELSTTETTKKTD